MISSALYCEQVRMNEKSVTEGQSVRIFSARACHL